MLKQIVSILLVSLLCIFGGYQLTLNGFPFYQIALIELVAIVIIFTVLHFASDRDKPENI